MKFPNVTHHICGQCAASFVTEAEYLQHTCPSGGLSPKPSKQLKAKVSQPVTPPKKKVDPLFEKDIIAAVKSARQEKKS